MYGVWVLWGYVYGWNDRNSPITSNTCPSKNYQPPRKALRGGISKSILQRPCQFWEINAHKMAPRTTQWFQERPWDAPTKGLAWAGCGTPPGQYPQSRIKPALSIYRLDLHHRSAQSLACKNCEERVVRKDSLFLMSEIPLLWVSYTSYTLL